MFTKHATNFGLIAIVLILAGVSIAMLSMQQGSKAWREVKPRIMPQLIPSTNKTLVPIVTASFSETVDVGFVIDAETKYQFVEKDMLEAWDIDVEGLYNQAIKNLDARSRNINVEVAEASDDDPTAKYVIVELDDGYAAARILSADVRRAIARELGDEYIAAIPTRDFLIFWHAQFPLFDAFAKQVQVEYDAEDTYKISPVPFFVNKYGIEEMKRREETTEE